jgi:hypothetical protein
MIDLARESTILQELVQEEILENLRQVVIDIVLLHFPKLVNLAKKQLRTIKTKEKMTQILLQLSGSTDLTAAQEILLALDGNDA